MRVIKVFIYGEYRNFFIQPVIKSLFTEVQKNDLLLSTLSKSWFKIGTSFLGITEPKVLEVKNSFDKIIFSKKYNSKEDVINETTNILLKGSNKRQIKADRKFFESDLSKKHFKDCKQTAGIVSGGIKGEGWININIKLDPYNELDWGNIKAISIDSLFLDWITFWDENISPPLFNMINYSLSGDYSNSGFTREIESYGMVTKIDITPTLIRF